MGWKDTARRIVGPGPGLRAEYRAGFANPSSDLLDAWGGNKSYAGHSVTADKAFRLGPVFAAVSIIAETIGAMPLKVYRELDEGGQKIEAGHAPGVADAPRQAEHHDVARTTFGATTDAHLLLWGNAFLAKGRDPDTGLVDELYHLAPVLRGSRNQRRPETLLLHRPRRGRTPADPRRRTCATSWASL